MRTLLVSHYWRELSSACFWDDLLAPEKLDQPNEYCYILGRAHGQLRSPPAVSESEATRPVVASHLFFCSQQFCLSIELQENQCVKEM